MRCMYFLSPLVCSLAQPLSLSFSPPHVSQTSAFFNLEHSSAFSMSNVNAHLQGSLMK